MNTAGKTQWIAANGDVAHDCAICFNRERTVTCPAAVIRTDPRHRAIILHDRQQLAGCEDYARP